MSNSFVLCALDLKKTSIDTNLITLHSDSISIRALRRPSPWLVLGCSNSTRNQYVQGPHSVGIKNSI